MIEMIERIAVDVAIVSEQEEVKPEEMRRMEIDIMFAPEHANMRLKEKDND